MARKCARRAGRNDSEIVLAQGMHKNDSACVFAIERTKVFHKLHQFAVVPRVARGAKRLGVR